VIQLAVEAQSRGFGSTELASPMQHQGGLLLLLLVATNRIEGRVTAWQVAAALLASFFARLR